MVVPEGYKQTEIGVIPDDWAVTNLGLMTEKVGSGITPTGGQRVYKPTGRPFVRSQNIGWGNLLLDDVTYIDDLTHAAFPETEIKLGDVFLNITGEGRCAVADVTLIGGNVNQHVCIIRIKSPVLSPRYLNFFLISINGQRQIDSFQTGGTRQGLNVKQVRFLGIPVPQPQEQVAIAGALSDADALITSLEKLIVKKKAHQTGCDAGTAHGKAAVAWV